jgi:hypothetical protein
MDRWPNEPGRDDEPSESFAVDFGARIAAAMGEPTVSKALVLLRMAVSSLVCNGVNPLWVVAKAGTYVVSLADGQTDLHGFTGEGRRDFYRAPRKG